MLDNMEATMEVKKTKKRKKPGLYGDGRLYKRGRIWWYRLGSMDKSTGKMIQAEAMAVRDLWKAEIKNDIPALQKIVTVGILLDDYLAHREANHAKSIKTIFNAVKRLRITFGGRVAASITSADLMEYRKTRTDEQVLPATINNELAYMRAAYNHGMKRQTPAKVEKVPHFPIAKVNNTRTGFIEVDGYLKILDELPNSLKALFAAGFHWGNRKSELTNLKWSSVNFEDGFVALEVGSTKNGEGRWLPICGDMQAMLQNQKNIRDAEFPDCDYVFFWHSDAVQTSHIVKAAPGDKIKSFRATWEKAVTKAGYPDLLFHDLRRSAVRNMVQKSGLGEAESMKISGHKTVSMFQRYNIINRDGIKASGDKMGKWLEEAKQKLK